jgi:hypothetical protein
MPQQREESIVDTVLAIWARRRFVAVVAFLTVLAGGLTVTLSLPAMYRSAASVLVQREELRDSLVRPGLTSELEARLRTIGQEALSRARLETLLERFDLYHTLRTRSTTEEAVEQLRRDIGLELTSAEVANGRSTIAFTLSFRGRDPDTVARSTSTRISRSARGRRVGPRSCWRGRWRRPSSGWTSRSAGSATSSVATSASCRSR